MKKALGLLIFALAFGWIFFSGISTLSSTFKPLNQGARFAVVEAPSFMFFLLPVLFLLIAISLLLRVPQDNKVYQIISTLMGAGTAIVFIFHLLVYDKAT